MRLAIPATLGAALLAAQGLTTDYGTERILRIESESYFSLETTDMERLVDGEPMEASWGGGAESEEVRRVVRLDHFKAGEPGRPMRVIRSFETLDLEGNVTFGEGSRDWSRQGPLAGVELELVVDDDGEVHVEILDGESPDDPELLEGHELALSLDALLPVEEIEEGEAWTLEEDAIRRALALALDARLFPAPDPEASDGDRGGGRGRRRGGGGGMGMLAGVEWSGQATVESFDEDVDGVSCAVIAIELEGSGELPSFGGGGGRRGFALAPELPATADENGVELSLEGRLLFSNADGHPLRLELEGEVSTVRAFERERDGRTMSIRHEQEGLFELTVSITEERE